MVSKEEVETDYESNSDLSDYSTEDSETDYESDEERK